ncbi:unnamed protein product [Arabis nemorensis]|uniref:Uncharacterized protein n=1 Tax=Arabis nemorensis TaxID=586526 RepID=A0A565C4E2_9BRAS|nr:unnamed protein product [Arabis nemorensis]
MSSLSFVSLLTGFLTAMAVITDITDDVSNGGDPPKEDEEKPKQVISDGGDPPKKPQESRSFVLTIPNAVIDTGIGIFRLPILWRSHRFSETLRVTFAPQYHRTCSLRVHRIPSC